MANEALVVIEDPTVTQAEMNAYGYSWNGMIPLRRERALQLFDEDYGIFLLHSNDAESMVESREWILEHEGLFGIEDPAWTE